MKRFIESNRLEIIAILVALTGFWLVYDQLSSISTLQSGVTKWFESLHVQIERRLQAFDAYILGLSTADLLGFVLIVGAVTFILWRARYRFLKSVGWRSKLCPRCGSSLHRIHRTALDRLLEHGILPHSRRYRCTNPDCHWTGLKHHKHISRHQHLFDEEPLAQDR